MLTAITREPSASMVDCELTFMSRDPIDIELLRRQHHAYRKCLSGLGLNVIALPPLDDLQDAVFVEDCAVVVDELAVITIMGAASRVPETEDMAAVLSRYRQLEHLALPASLDGGDVLKVDRTLYVGMSTRTNEDGVDQLREFLSPHDYAVKSVKVPGCLHLKTGITYLGRDTLLANTGHVDTAPFKGMAVVPVPEDEPSAANVLKIGDEIVMPESFPLTTQLLRDRGFSVHTVDISELQKAEGGVTCLSIVLNADC